jgi:hypothetical protein
MLYESCYTESCYAESCYAESCYAESYYTASGHADSRGMSQRLTVAHRSGQLAYPKKEKCGGVGKKASSLTQRHTVESFELRQRVSQKCPTHFLAVRFAIRLRRILKSGSGLARGLTIDVVKSPRIYVNLCSRGTDFPQLSGAVISTVDHR